MIRYHLYPPFLYIPEETDFSDTWEVFCLKLLKLELKTSNIERRMPPDIGVDLYYKDNNIAYQCKSCDSTGKFNITKARDSLKAALTIKDSLPWNEYNICSNSNLTGSHIEKLQELYNNVNAKGHDYWVGLCNKYPNAVRNNFRILIDIPINRYYSDLDIQLVAAKLNLKNRSAEEHINILFYSSKYDKMYDLPVSKKITVDDLLDIFSSFFHLSREFTRLRGLMRIYHYIIFDGNEYGKNEINNMTLEDIGIKDFSLVNYCLEYYNTENRMSDKVMQFITPNNNNSDKKQLIKNLFNTFDLSL